MVIDKEAISSFATSLVKDSIIIRVIGTARQEAIVNNTSDKVNALAYLKSIEKRLDHDHEKHPFTYLRVVPQNIEEPLQKHIDECNNISNRTGNRFELIKLNSKDFDFFVSYQLFDDKHLLLIIDNKVLGQYNDNSLCLWTKNKKIIDVFCKHFDNAFVKNIESI